MFLKKQAKESIITEDKLLKKVTGGNTDEEEMLDPVYYIDPAKCVLCGECKDMCPTGAISKGHYAYVIDPSRCIYCDSCRRACPYGVPDLGVPTSR